MKKGFTLAELLIALAILGVIATFTIPKVLQGQQDGKFKSIVKGFQLHTNAINMQAAHPRARKFQT